MGHWGGAIDRIDQHGRVTKAFIKLDNKVISLAAHKNRLYTFIDEPVVIPLQLFVHNLSDGQLINFSRFPSFYYNVPNIKLIGDYQLAAGDWYYKKIIIYSLHGHVIRTVPFPPSLTMSCCGCMSSCGDDSVVISDHIAGNVVRMSLKDGSLLWSSDRVTNPGGIVHHPAGYVLVVNNYVDNTTIYVLNEKDGWYCNIAVVSKSFSYPDGCDA